MNCYEQMNEGARSRFRTWITAADNTELAQFDPEDDEEVEYDPSKLLEDQTSEKAKRRRYTRAYKSRILSYSEMRSVPEAADEYECSRNSIYAWKRKRKAERDEDYENTLESLSRKVEAFDLIKGEEALDTLLRVVEHEAPSPIDFIRPFFARILPNFAGKTERLLVQLIEAGKIEYIQAKNLYILVE